MLVQPYLFFDGRCDEALNFYEKALGAKVTMLMRFGDSPNKGGIRPGTEKKVMHAALKLGDSTFYASDGDCAGKPSFKGFGLSTTVKEVPEAQRLFNAVSEGGKVVMPMTEMFYSPSFGMAHDKFGVLWMILAEKK